MPDNTPTSPDCYWVEPGQFLAGEYPGHREEAMARAKVDALVAAGVRVFVDLTEPGEYRLEPYDPLLVDAGTDGHDLEYHRLSIRDVSVPSRQRMAKILAVIRRSLDAGRPVYVHCYGGTGRTGTVVGCWLVEQGRAGDDFVETLRELRARCAKRWRSSPDTDEQEEFVRAWSRRAE